MQFAVQTVAAGAISVESSPIIWPMRPPLATLHWETPPQWFTAPGWNAFGMLFGQPLEIRVAVEELERKLMLRVLGAADDNKAEAARLLGISERTLWYKLKRYGL